MRSTIATIDLDALRWNLKTIRRMVDSSRILGMVKANAYGHGILQVSTALEQSGIDMLGVAYAEEGIQLRKNGIQAPILVLTPILTGEAEIIVENNLIPTVHSPDQAQAISNASLRAGKNTQMHLYVDTGMHRDGVLPGDVLDVLKSMDELKGASVTGICTHFATADQRHDPFIQEQLKIFNHVVDTCRKQGRTFAEIHSANTGAIWQERETHFTLVRPGLSLYGYAEPADDEMLLRPVMSISTNVGSTRRIRTGDTVSYGRKFVTPRDTTIATLPIGYGDGYLRSLSGKAQCLIRGRRYPIVGVICMDECMADVGDDQIEVGDDVVMLGVQADENGFQRSIDAAELAQWAGTIPYEITTAVSSRVPRRYVG